MKVGIIGCGSIALKRHAVEYKENPNCELIGYFDPHKERVDDMVRLFGGKAYDSVDELLADKEIELVSICSANASHAEYTIKALNAGKNVLCEKPMAVTFKDAKEMVDVAKKNGKRLFIGQNQRLTSAHKVVKELIASGKLGKVLTFSTVFGHGGPESWCVAKSANTWFFKKDKATFGSIGDLGIHKIDLMRFLLGKEAVKVYSVMKTLDKKFTDGSPIEVDDNSMQIIEFEGGVIGTVTTSWTHYACENNQTYIYCEKGMVKLYVDPVYPLVVEYRDGKKEEYNLEKIQTNEEGGQTSSGVIDLVVNSIESGEVSILDAEDVIKSMEVVFACVKSANTGEPVLINNKNQ